MAWLKFGCWIFGLSLAIFALVIPHTSGIADIPKIFDAATYIGEYAALTFFAVSISMLLFAETVDVFGNVGSGFARSMLFLIGIFAIFSMFCCAIWYGKALGGGANLENIRSMIGLDIVLVFFAFIIRLAKEA